MKVFGWGKSWSAAALVACLLALPAAGCGRSGSSESTAAATVEHVESGPTQAALHPVGDSGVWGKVVYAEKSPEVPLMKIRLTGVKKATGETQYFIWQMGDRHHMTSLASYYVPHGTKLSVNLEPGSESLGWLEDESKTQMLITWVKNDDVFIASQAHWTSAEDPTEIGVPVARGTFTGPLVGTTGD